MVVTACQRLTPVFQRVPISCSSLQKKHFVKYFDNKRPLCAFRAPGFEPILYIHGCDDFFLFTSNGPSDGRYAQFVPTSSVSCQSNTHTTLRHRCGRCLARSSCPPSGSCLPLNSLSNHNSLGLCRPAARLPFHCQTHRRQPWRSHASSGRVPLPGRHSAPAAA